MRIKRRSERKTTPKQRRLRGRKREVPQIKQSKQTRLGSRETEVTRDLKKINNQGTTVEDESPTTAVMKERTDKKKKKNRRPKNMAALNWTKLTQVRAREPDSRVSSRSNLNLRMLEGHHRCRVNRYLKIGFPDFKSRSKIWFNPVRRKARYRSKKAGRQLQARRRQRAIEGQRADQDNVNGRRRAARPTP